METKDKPRLFEKCGNCGQEVSKTAPLEVYRRHYDAECLNDMETPTKEEVGYVAKERRYTYAPGCSHVCSGNCRRVGCNCECGEYHGYYEEEPATQ